MRAGKYLQLGLAIVPLLIALVVWCLPLDSSLFFSVSTPAPSQPIAKAPALPSAPSTPVATASKSGISSTALPTTIPKAAKAQFPVQMFLQGNKWKSVYGQEFDGLLLVSAKAEVVVLRLDNQELHRQSRATLSPVQESLAKSLESEIEYLKRPLILTGMVKGVDYATLENFKPDPGAPACTVTALLVAGKAGNGTIQSRAANGRLYRAYEARAGKQQGLQVTFYPNQKPASFHFFDEKKCLMFIGFYPSGAIRSVLPSPNGQPNGVTVSYYENGRIGILGNQINGQPHGTLTTFTPSGDVFEVQEANRGRILSTKTLRNAPQERAAVEKLIIDIGPNQIAASWSQVQ